MQHRIIPEILINTVSSSVGNFVREEGDNLFRNPLTEEVSKPTDFTDAIDTTLYIHIPFCNAPLCEFCPFGRGEYDKDLVEIYLEDLRKELELYKGLSNLAVYIGGGTPVLLLEGLVSIINDFELNKVSLSMETHPRDLKPKNIMAMIDAGVTRVSVGVQSFDKELLKLMKRKNGKHAKRNLEAAQKAFDVVNVDLMFNFPDQTVEQFENDLDQLIEMEIGQITCYPLMPSPGTFNDVDPSGERKFYDAMLAKFKDNNYFAITPWCFVKTTEEQKSVVQGEYITATDGTAYLGVGVTAISFLGKKFSINEFDLEKYHNAIDQGRFPTMAMNKLSKFNNIQYNLLISLFGMKIDINKISGSFKEKKLVIIELRVLQAAGLVKKKGSVFNVTEEGMFYLSTLMKDFYTGLNYFRADIKEDIPFYNSDCNKV